MAGILKTYGTLSTEEVGRIGDVVDFTRCFQIVLEIMR